MHRQSQTSTPATMSRAPPCASRARCGPTSLSIGAMPQHRRAPAHGQAGWPARGPACPPRARTRPSAVRSGVSSDWRRLQGVRDRVAGPGRARRKRRGSQDATRRSSSKATTSSPGDDGRRATGMIAGDRAWQPRGTRRRVGRGWPGPRESPGADPDAAPDTPRSSWTTTSFSPRSSAQRCSAARWASGPRTCSSVDTRMCPTAIEAERGGREARDYSGTGIERGSVYGHACNVARACVR